MLRSAPRVGKPLEHPFQGPWTSRIATPNDGQVLPDTERRENAASLRNQADAAPCDALRRLAGYVLAQEPDLAATWGRLAHDCPHECRLSHAVAADHDGRLGGIHADRHTVEDLRISVEGVAVHGLQQRGHIAPLDRP
jgi:hypothetical protein